jgi:hypothetical protein
MRFRSLPAVAGICALTLAGHTQAHPSTASPQTSYLTAPFDPTVSHLSAHFKGHDITALLRVIEYAPSLKDKSEFETTAAYDARIASFSNHPLYGALRATSLIALVVPANRASFTYEADTQRLATSFDPGTESDTNYPSVALRHSTRVSGSYEASNAFNAHTRVTKYHDEDFGIAFPEQGSVDITAPITLSADAARRHKPGLRLLLIVKPIVPWSNYDKTFHGATMTEPEDTTTETHNLYSELKGIWLFDENTGEVLQKFDPGPEECQGANKASDEPYADCVKRVKKRNADCAAAGDVQACIDKITAQYKAEKEAQRKSLPICGDAPGALRCRLN